MGPDDNGQNEGVMWFDSGKGAGFQSGIFQHQHHILVFLFQNSQNGISHRREQRGMGRGAQPVFHADGDAKQPAQQIVARPVTLPRFANVEQMANAPLPRGIQAALVYPAQTLEANSAVERQIVFFAGPKEYRTLARIGEEFQIAPTS